MEEDLETLEFEEPKTEAFSCRGCAGNKYCRKHSVMKGSITCEQGRGLAPKKKKKEPSDQAKSLGLLSYLMKKKEGK